MVEGTRLIALHSRYRVPSENCNFPFALHLNLRNLTEVSAIQPKGLGFLIDPQPAPPVIAISVDLENHKAHQLP